MRYYVYALIDPRNDAVFYIGKGSKDRINMHEKEALKGVYSRKCEKIRSILADGFNIKKTKLKHFWSEKDAYDFEKELIHLIGLDRLTNVVAGGGGIPAKIIKKTQEQKASDWLNILLLRPNLTAQWFASGRKKATATTESTNARVKVIAMAVQSLFNVFPLALSNVIKDKESREILAKEMKDHGVILTYA